MLTDHGAAPATRANKVRDKTARDHPRYKELLYIVSNFRACKREASNKERKESPSSVRSVFNMFGELFFCLFSLRKQTLTMKLLAASENLF